jgi:tetratricopeptide (TPR) repeat protein
MKTFATFLLIGFAFSLFAVDTATDFTSQWTSWQDSLSAKPNDPTALVNMMYLTLQESDRIAAGLSARVDSLAPGMVFALANYKLSRNEYEAAIPLYEKLNATFPKWSCPFRHKGEALLKLGRLDESKAALEAAIAVQANHADAYIMLAEVMQKQGDYKKALATLDKGLSYVSSSPEGENEMDMTAVSFQRLELLKLSKQKAEYKTYSAELRSKFPDNPYWNKE